MEEEGRNPGSITTFLAVQWVTRESSDFPSHLPAARERCDQMVLYYNRWEQKKKKKKNYISMHLHFSSIKMLLEYQEALLPFRSH